MEHDRCLQAIRAKERRFDGVFYTGVTSTGIYCRPSCPAMTPRADRVCFYATAAAAQLAGFRACKRCRPDASPGSPEWNQRFDVASRAVRLIADGVIEREGVPGLAHRLGYSERQLRRICENELGAAPLALARAERVRVARTLLECTTLAMPEVAYASGFGSLRQFNDAVATVYAMTPTALRQQSKTTNHPNDASLALRLPLRPPLHVTGLFGHLAATAIPGVETIHDGAYHRTLRLAYGTGVVSLRPNDDHLECRLWLSDLRDLASAVARCRRVADLDADPTAIDNDLRRDPKLRPLVRAGGGRRIPGSVDGHEWALRAVLGQQVSTLAARTLAARLTTELGEAVTPTVAGCEHLFPSADAIAGAPDALLAMPHRRRTTVRVVAALLASGELDLSPGADRIEALARLAAVPGVGPWTVAQIAMRGFGDPDVWLPNDLGVVRAAAARGLPSTARELARYAERWSPWRSYAVQYLWGATAHSINDSPFN
jgi:AraC family transcriptional regulator of adaptative response / DNA-3-methyladenine glycosylase II